MYIEEISSFLSSYFQTTSPYVISLEVVLLSFLCAWLVNWFFGTVLKKVLRRTPSEFDDEIFGHIGAGIFWSVVMGGVYLSLYPYNFFSRYQDLAGKIILSLAGILWSWILAEVVTAIFEQLIQRSRGKAIQERKGLVPFLENVFRIVAGLLVVLVIFGIWGIDIGPVLASAGVLGVAIGFAAKDTVANLFGGLSVFFDQPYKVGDYVIVQDDYRGEVVEIGMRSTKIKTRDNVLLTAPNSVMITGVVVNETGHDDKLRIRIPLSVSYDTDLEFAESVLKEIMESHQEILDEPVSPVLYRRFGESAIELEALGVLGNPARKGAVVHELIKLIHDRFQKEGIKMPAPQREVLLRRVEGV